MVKKSSSILLAAALFMLIFPVKSTYAVKAGDIYNNEILVKYKPDYNPVKLRSKVSGTVKATSIGSLANRVISILSNSKSDEQRLIQIQSTEKKLGIIPLSTTKLGNSSLVQYKVKDPNQYASRLKALSSNSAIEYAEPNYILKTMAVTPDDEFYADKQWSLKKIEADKAWDITKGKSDVKVAVIDTGVSSANEDLKGHIVDQKDFGHCDSENIEDEVGHGSHVAGIIGAMTNNQKGVAGLNWDISILGLKVGCDTGYFSALGIVQATNYAVEHGARIINMSFGFKGFDQAIADAIADAAKKNVLIVAAGGNNEPELSSSSDEIFPGNIVDNVIAVSATGPQDEIAAYSSTGANIFLSAPGGNPAGDTEDCRDADCILSTALVDSDGEYMLLSGTSQAAPHVVGVAALMLSVNPSLTAAQIRDILQATAVDLGDKGRDNKFGYGRLNAFKAVEQAKNGGGGGGTITPGAGTGTVAPTSGGGTVAATMTPAGGAGTVAPTGVFSAECIEKRKKGDCNCDDTVDLKDYEDYWLPRYKESKETLQCFEFWRSAFYKE